MSLGESRLIREKKTRQRRRKAAVHECLKKRGGQSDRCYLQLESYFGRRLGSCRQAAVVYVSGQLACTRVNFTTLATSQAEILRLSDARSDKCLAGECRYAFPSLVVPDDYLL